MRRVGILVRCGVYATGELVGRADARRAGNVDVHIGLVLRIDEHGVRVRPAAGLNIGNVLWLRDVRDVENADAAQPVLADHVFHALIAAINAARGRLARHEEQILVHRNVALRGGAVVRELERRGRRIRDVPDLVSVVAPLNHVVAREREIGVRAANELCRGRHFRENLEIPSRLRGVVQAGLQAYARIGIRRLRQHGRRDQRAAKRGRNQSGSRLPESWSLMKHWSHGVVLCVVRVGGADAYFGTWARLLSQGARPAPGSAASIFSIRAISVD